MAADESLERRAFMQAIRDRFPGFREAVRADARATADYRGERYEFRSRPDLLAQIVRLCVQSDAFLAQVLYRAKASMQRRGIPLLPRLAHKLAMSTAQVSIGDPVVVGGGLYLMHGQIVIDGLRPSPRRRGDRSLGDDRTCAPVMCTAPRSEKASRSAPERRSSGR